MRYVTSCEKFRCWGIGRHTSLACVKSAATFQRPHATTPEQQTDWPD